MNSILHSIHINLLAGSAYLTVLEGLWVTILISLFSVLAGSAIGAVFCYFRMSNIRIFSLSSQYTVAILRGSPVLLLLMILYYVVFADNRIDAIYVAIAAFALNSGAHISEIIRSALMAVDKKQIEAARMLGFTRTGAFFAVTLPMAGKIAKPVYQSAVINLIQWTSVVGYVSITDLTRTVNNIGNRTGDPFFPLFFGVILYLLLSYFVYVIFSFGEKKAKAND